MPEYLITTESTSDLPLAYLAERSVPVLRAELRFSGETREDPMEGAAADEAYRALLSGEPLPTALIGTARFHAFWEPFLVASFDVLHLGASGALSGTWETAKRAAESLMRAHPGRTVVVPDTRAVSGGLGLLVELVCRQKARGLSLTATADFVENHRLSVQHLFTADGAKTLKGCGRLSAGNALFDDVLHFRPVLELDASGAIVPRDHAVSRQAAIRSLRSRFLQKNRADDYPEVLIRYVDRREEAEQLGDSLLTALPDLLIDTRRATPAVAAAVGGGGLGLFFVGRGRH